jgi:RNA polymerase sigma-70 factor (ECF subfamily)
MRPMRVMPVFGLQEVLENCASDTYPGSPVVTLMLQDRALLEAFRAGDPGALRKIYDAYVADVERAALRGLRSDDGKVAVRVRSVEELADVVQEVFVRVFSPASRRGYDGLRPFRPFLLTVARNVVADHFRSRAREVPFDPGAPLDAATDEAAAEDEGWLEHRRLTSIEQYVAVLPPELKALHHARFVVGLSQESAARTLRSTRQQVRTLEQQLRDGVRAWLVSQGLMWEC